MVQGLVSAIITTHNRKELLVKSIESVMSQTYTAIECIVIDDASTDGTKDYIKKFINNQQIRYVYIQPEESKGGNYARNLGIKYASGEYVAFCDDDDEWFETKIEKQVNLMKTNPQIGFVYCGMVVEKNCNISTRKNRPDKVNKYIEGDISKQILLRIITTTTTIMVKKSLLQEIGGFDENLKYWQEYELCIRVLQKTQAGAVKENLILYRNITKDRNRLSNKIYGWEQSVRYIESKHKNLIATLSDKENAIRKMYIYIDGFLRGYNARSFKYIIKYAGLMIYHRNIRKLLLKKVYQKIHG